MRRPNVFRLLRIAAPVITRTMPRIIAATMPASEDGSTFSDDELEDILTDLGLQIGEAILQSIRNSADIIDAGHSDVLK